MQREERQKMNKFPVLKTLNHNGDSTLILKQGEPIVVTTDFSTPYIRKKKFGKYEIQKNCIFVFSWTDDKFINIPVENIKKILPLSQILGNTKNAEQEESW